MPPPRQAGRPAPLASATAAAAAALVLLGRLAPAAAQEGRRLVTSGPCIAALDTMIKNDDWKFMNTTWTTWCRVKLENEMAKCCSVADFEKGRGEGCGSCQASCIHPPFIAMCNAWFGTACVVSRKPFHRTGAPELISDETFCVPTECNNAADRQSLMQWYAAKYKTLRAGWHRNYDSTELNCPDGVAEAMGITVAVIVGIIGFAFLWWFLRTAPKEKGRELVSQSDMVQEDEDDAPEDTLRNTGTGFDALGNSGMS
eukprot:TRINITY_DN31580_c0_g1_i1.p1 TRINITY_DN31580_c0_g1~~TRINITY_DN31580_c0_g1_i1.p1  ORF type:complete len:257 (-),score=56.81 TRINITY_DN31580_c0_g1_i1:130-900(-)